MLIPIFKGSATVLLGAEDSFLKCPSCESTQLAEIFVFSKYYYVYGIPISPVGKEANIKCTKCGLERRGIPFEKGMEAFDGKQNKYRHPWYTYIGIGFAIFILLLPLLVRWAHVGSLSKI